MNCESIAKSNAREINDIWHGLYVHCPVCGDMWSLDPDAYGQPAECQNCHEEMEEYDLYAWLDDQLEISGSGTQTATDQSVPPLSSWDAEGPTSVSTPRPIR